MPFTLKTAQYIYTTISNSLTPVRKIYFYKTLTSCHNCQSKLLQLSIYFYNCQSIFNNCQSSSCSSFTLPFLAISNPLTPVNLFLQLSNQLLFFFHTAIPGYFQSLDTCQSIFTTVNPALVLLSHCHSWLFPIL